MIFIHQAADLRVLGWTFDERTTFSEAAVLTAIDDTDPRAVLLLKGGATISADLTVTPPAKPPDRKAMLAAATTIAELKAVLEGVV